MKNFALALVLILAFGCADTTNNKAIIGSWQATEWLQENRPSGNEIAGTSFEFKADEQYAYTYANSIEKGTYKVENNMLFTKPTGGMEMMVIIKKLTADSLVFEMNRSGVREQLILLRKQ